MSTVMFMTGASSGIGAAVAASRPADIDRFVSYSRRPGIVGEWVEVDVSHPRQWPTIMESFDAVLDSQSWDRAIFFHCSGTGEPLGRLIDVDRKAYALSMTLNAAAGASLGQAFLQATATRAIPATLVMCGSPAAEKFVPGMSQYCSGKAAMHHWSRIAAAEQETSPYPARVITVVPYAVRTAMVDGIIDQDPDTVPLVNYFRDVEAKNAFSTPESTAEQIWTAIRDADNGAFVPVGSIQFATPTP